MKRASGWCLPVFALVLGASACSTDTKVETVDTTPACSAAAPYGKCTGAGEVCFEGACVAEATICSESNLTGVCPAHKACFEGGCVLASSLCSVTNTSGHCATGNTCFEGSCVATASLCSETNTSGVCPDGEACTPEGICATPGVDPCTVHVYTTQPTIAMRAGPMVTATATATLTAAAANDTLTVGGWAAQDNEWSFKAVPGIVFTAVASGSTPTNVQFAIGANDAATATNLAAAINANTAASALVTATASANVVTLAAKQAGVLGNGINLAGTSTRIAVSGPTGSVTNGAGTGKSPITVDGLTFRDASGDGQLQPYEDWRLSELCRAKDLAKRIGRVEKIGMLKSGILDVTHSGESLSSTLIGQLRNARYRQGMTAHIFATGAGSPPDVWAKWHNKLEEYVEADTWGVPVLAITDPAHNGAGAQFVTSMVGTLGLGAINDVNVTAKAASIIRDEFMALGIRLEYGPMADVATEPRWTRVDGTFGENALSVANHVRTYVSGFQNSTDGSVRNGIIAMIKHFPGHGSEYDGYDYHGGPRENRWAIFPGNNFEYHWIPFQAAFDVGAAAMMPCYVIYVGQYEWDPEQVAAGFSYGIVTRLAKEKMGFKGFVSGDWGTLTNAYGQETLTETERSIAWFKAGSHQWGDNLYGTYDAYDTGRLSEDEINFAVAKVIEGFMKLGLFENPYLDPEHSKATVKKAEFRQFGFDSMKKAMVILKNAEHTTPESSGGCPPGVPCGPVAASYLPIAGDRKNADGTYVDDTNGDGTIKVFYEGSTKALNGSDSMDDLLEGYDYRVPTPATGALRIDYTSNLDEADIWVYRFTSSIKGYDADQTAARNKIIDAMRKRDGYKKADGTRVAATNPKLKIVAVMNVKSAAVIPWLVNGLVSLDEPSAPVAPATTTYPLVDDPANVRSSVGGGVDAIVAEFYATDRAVLDVLFNKNIPVGDKGYGRSVLPLEFPSSLKAVQDQFEDVPADSLFPTFKIGFPSKTY